MLNITLTLKNKSMKTKPDIRREVTHGQNEPIVAEVNPNEANISVT